MSTTESALHVAPGADASVEPARPLADAGPIVTIGGQVVGPATGQLAGSSSVPAITSEQVAIERIAMVERLRATARLRQRKDRAGLTGLSGQAQAGLLIAALVLLAVVTLGIVRALAHPTPCDKHC